MAVANIKTKHSISCVSKTFTQNDEIVKKYFIQERFCKIFKCHISDTLQNMQRIKQKLHIYFIEFTTFKYFAIHLEEKTLNNELFN